jgi:hypothetical protein
VSREIEIHASLLHPNVVRLYAAFEDADGIYLVQEYASRGERTLGGHSCLLGQQAQACSWLAGKATRHACIPQRPPPLTSTLLGTPPSSPMLALRCLLPALPCPASQVTCMWS